MKRQIRRGVFETNSSSTHSITMCKTEDYNKWTDGLVYIDEYGEAHPKNDETIEQRRKVITEYLKKNYDIEEDVLSKITDKNYAEVLRENGIDLDECDLHDIVETLFMQVGLEYDEWYDIYSENCEDFCSEFNGVTAFGFFGMSY